MGKNVFLLLGSTKLSNRISQVMQVLVAPDYDTSQHTDLNDQHKKKLSKVSAKILPPSKGLMKPCLNCRMVEVVCSDIVIDPLQK